MTPSSNASESGASPTTRCPHCAHPMPAGAKYCTICELWCIEPPDLRLRRRWAGGLSLASSIALPLAMLIAGQYYESATKAREQAESALQRENQVVASLSEAVVGTLNVSNEFHRALIDIQHACEQGVAPAEGVGAGLCDAPYAAALVKLDLVANSLSWAVATVPVTTDTYRRMIRFKDRYWLGCGPADGDEMCGYRALFLRRLARSPSAGPQLRYCLTATSPTERQVCGDALAALRRDVRDPLSDDMTGVLCGLTRDANEMRRLMWQRMRDRGPSLGELDLARRLEDNQQISSCTRLFEAQPVHAPPTTRARRIDL
jgi:hypothetical protein